MVDDSRREAQCNELDFTPCAPFTDVTGAEYRDIHERRKVAGQPADADTAKRPHDITGLALSGGGIRSATFNLGVLQALHRWGLLGHFDYLCTTSGGGYVGGWWSAWLSRAKRSEIFPPAEKLELDRHDALHEHQKHEATTTGFQYEHTQISDSAMSAGNDPVHHLRLYGNYITPKKGLFSADTWRAFAIVSRNIVLTWLILIPVLLATVLAGQAYFALLPVTADAFLVPDSSEIAHPALAQACGVNVAKLAQYPAREHLLQRLAVALAPPTALMFAVFVCGLLWMLTVPQYWEIADYLLVLLSNIVAGLITAVIVALLPIDYGRIPHPHSLGAILIGVFGVIFGLLLFLTYVQQKHSAKLRDVDYWRNRLVRLHAKFLLGAVVLAGILLFAGFGHEVVAFLIGKTHMAAEKVTRTGGWGALIMTVLGSIYTALSASPKGGADASEKKPPSTINKIAYALFPVLLILLLALAAASVGHGLYRAAVVFCDNSIPWIIWGSFATTALCLALCLYEFRPSKHWPILTLLAIWVAIAIFIVVRNRVTLRHDMAIAACVLVGLLMRARLRTRHHDWHWWYTIVPIVAGIVTYALIRTIPSEGAGVDWRKFEILVAILLLFCFTLLLFELGFGQGTNRRSFSLLFIAFLTLTLISAAPYLGDAYERRWIAMTGLIAITLGWVIALGWLADPNALSGHGFYKSRLVRAYLGASNPRRAYQTGKDQSNTEVTDAVPGDDVLLTALSNCETGAPFHIITTTLNLVGGQDLATAQRSSDMFTLTKRHCGSLRTGFRPTNEWMCGTMSLGTAISVSGAAASPNMGAQSPSAAMAMLMTLFNVRLGYWAPTPNRSYWRSSAPRLWPVYTIEELLSQTNDLLPYCYLTDGGHFDNTSLYPLFARGARFIVNTDCGYDPTPTFDDLGAVIRKARIDFDVEVEIDLEPLRVPDKVTGEPLVHFIVGRITYSESHAKYLGWNADEPRDGVLLCLKPNRATDVTADVRTYGWNNKEFPQTPTGNQFFDEAQWESYRQLGEETVDSVMKALQAKPGNLGAVFAEAKGKV